MMMDDGALRCGECGAPVTSISRGRQVQEDGTLGPPEPAKFGCGHLAGEFGRLVKMDLTANAPGPEVYWPERLGEQGTVTLRGYYDQPEVEATSYGDKERSFMAHDGSTRTEPFEADDHG